MSRAAWILCLAWIAGALATSILGARRAEAAQRAASARRALTPAVGLFVGYLVIAAIAIPRSPGETTSPLLWLGLGLPLWFAAASFASAGLSRAGRGLVALVFAGAVCAFAAIVLALASPAFVPAWLR